MLIILAALLFSTTSSYILVPKFKTWTEAELYCKTKYKSNLASFHNDADAKKLLTKAKNAKTRDPWIGLNDRKDEATWIFTDNTKGPSFKYWVDDPIQQPDNKGSGEDCVVVSRSSNAITAMIHDVHCGDPATRHFICNDGPDGGQACIPAGLNLGLEHACVCSSSCKEEDTYCNTFDFVFGKVGGSTSPHENLCPESGFEVCCCSCQNCPDYKAPQVI